MRERLIELLKDAYYEYLIDSTENERARIADYLLKNGVVVLPCGIDDSVFVIPTKENCRKEITPMACLGFVIGNSGSVANCFGEKNKLYQPSFDAFGTTVFLTYEEAEAALKSNKQ